MLSKIMRLSKSMLCLLLAVMISEYPLSSSGYLLPIHHATVRSPRCISSTTTHPLSMHRVKSSICQNRQRKTTQPSSTSLYFLKRRGNKDTISPSPNEGGNKFNALRIRLKKAVQQIVTFPGKFRTKFSKLSKRGKQLFIIQLFCLTMIFGGLGRKAYVKYTNNGAPMSRRPPVEVAYSQFLDLVEQSGGSKSSSTSSVAVDNIRIGNDRISYRVTKSPSGPSTISSQSASTAAQISPSTTRLLSGIRGRSSKNAAASASKAVATSPAGESGVQQFNVFTRKVNASPELINFLRSNDMPFAAAPVPRSSSFAMIARSIVLVFYMFILFRMYKVFTGNLGAGGTGGASETPGKLASPLGGNLPLASFDDIQGIDDAKLEVMELVDTLRYPDKYAILGARAPTGLLLEGPPGTGKVRRRLVFVAPDGCC